MIPSSQELHKWDMSNTCEEIVAIALPSMIRAKMNEAHAGRIAEVEAQCKAALTYELESPWNMEPSGLDYTSDTRLGRMLIEGCEDAG